MTNHARPTIHLAIGLATLCWGCGDGALSPTATSVATAATSLDQPPLESTRHKAPGTSVTCQPGMQCQFDHGLTTCSWMVAQQTIAGTHDEISGCVAYDGTTSRPGRRTRHYEDVLLVTTTETTRAHGLCGPAFDSSTSDQQQLVSSRLMSDVCEAI